MLIACMKTTETDETYEQYLTIKKTSLIKKTNLENVTVSRSHNAENELAKKRFVDDSIGEGEDLTK